MVREFARTAGAVLGAPSPFNAVWREAVERFGREDWAGAQAKLDAAARLVPNLPDVQRLQAETELRLLQASRWPSPWTLGGVVVALLAATGGAWWGWRRRRAPSASARGVASAPTPAPADPVRVSAADLARALGAEDGPGLGGRPRAIGLREQLRPGEGRRSGECGGCPPGLFRPGTPSGDRPVLRLPGRSSQPPGRAAIDGGGVHQGRRPDGRFRGLGGGQSAAGTNAARADDDGRGVAVGTPRSGDRPRPRDEGRRGSSRGRERRRSLFQRAGDECGRGRARSRGAARN